MAEEFNIDFESEDAAIAGQEKLEALRVGGEPAMAAKREGTGLRCQCLVWTRCPSDAKLEIDGQRPHGAVLRPLLPARPGEERPAPPDGLFWVHTPSARHAVHDGRVQLMSIAPTILESFGAPVPEHMRSERLPLA